MQKKAARKPKGKSALSDEPKGNSKAALTRPLLNRAGTNASGQPIKPLISSEEEQQFCTNDHPVVIDVDADEQSTAPKRARACEPPDATSGGADGDTSDSSLFTRIRASLLLRRASVDEPSTASASRSASIDSIASFQSAQSIVLSASRLLGVGGTDGIDADADPRNLSLSAGDLSLLPDRDLLDIVEQPESAPNAAQPEPESESLAPSDAREMELLSQFHVANDESALWNECDDEDEDDDCVLVEEPSDPIAPFGRRTVPQPTKVKATVAVASCGANKSDSDARPARPANANANAKTGAADALALFDGVFLVPLYCEGFSRHAYGDTERRRGGALQVVRALEVLRPRFVVLYSPRVALVRTIEVPRRSNSEHY